MFDCLHKWVSGSLTKYFPFLFSLSVSFDEEISKKINLQNLSGSPPMLYKLVLGPIPILHTNFQENPLKTLGIFRHFKII